MSGTAFGSPSPLTGAVDSSQSRSERLSLYSPVAVVDQHSEQFDRWLGSVDLFGWHVQIVHEENRRLAHRRPVHTFPATIDLGHADQLWKRTRMSRRHTTARRVRKQLDCIMVPMHTKQMVFCRDLSNIFVGCTCLIRMILLANKVIYIISLLIQGAPEMLLNNMVVIPNDSNR